MKPLSLDIHRPIEAAIGLGLAAIPLLLSITGQVDFSAAAVILALLLGGIMATLAFAGGRAGDVVSPTLHSAIDQGLIGALVLLAILFAVTGEWQSAVLFALGLILFGLLALRTRYLGDDAPPRVR